MEVADEGGPFQVARQKVYMFHSETVCSASQMNCFAFLTNWFVSLSQMIEDSFSKIEELFQDFVLINCFDIGTSCSTVCVFVRPLRASRT